jgi:FtsH-binding integral membrane protein
MSSVFDRLTDAQAQGIVKQVEEPFKNLPNFPEGLANFIVTIAPWLTLLGGIFSIFGALSAVTVVLGADALMRSLDAAYVSPVMYGTWYYLVVAIFGVLIGILYLKAFSPLKDRKLSGWYMLFWATIINLVSSAIAVIYAPTAIIGALIGAAISFYILFKVKSYYTNDLAK